MAYNYTKYYIFIYVKIYFFLCVYILYINFLFTQLHAQQNVVVTGAHLYDNKPNGVLVFYFRLIFSADGFLKVAFTEM